MQALQAIQILFVIMINIGLSSSCGIMVGMRITRDLYHLHIVIQFMKIVYCHLMIMFFIESQINIQNILYILYRTYIKKNQLIVYYFSSKLLCATCINTFNKIVLKYLEILFIDHRSKLQFTVNLHFHFPQNEIPSQPHPSTTNPRDPCHGLIWSYDQAAGAGGSWSYDVVSRG